MAITLLTVGSTPLPNPQVGGYNVSLNDGDGENSGRSESFEMARERIRADMYTIGCNWIVTGADLAVITTAIAPATFDMTFYDPLTSTTKTRTFYAGNPRTSNLLKLEDTAEKSLWQLSFNFIEC